MTHAGLTPHGPGFRFIDRFEKTGLQSGIAWKYLDPSAPYFSDHFPGNPIMPAVLLVECAAQAAGVLLLHDSAAPDTPLFLASIDQFRILGPVFPAETLNTLITLEKELGPLVIFTAECCVGERTVALGRLLLSRELAKPTA
jgi:3-hydroxymyristoyl/3-hydroxydecanoyl-(acyl carrier protein) dehydratase